MLIAIGIIAVILIWGVTINNKLLLLKTGAANAWSQVEVQLKRRHDLIPNLIETVKGYAGHEKSTLDAVIKARNSAIAAPDINSQVVAENQLSGALRQLFALTENYPDLKANTNFLSLQEELVSTENKIAFSRQFFNDSVGTYNGQIIIFPNSIIAGFRSLTPLEYYEVSEEEKQAIQTPPKVSF